MISKEDIYSFNADLRNTGFANLAANGDTPSEALYEAIRALYDCINPPSALVSKLTLQLSLTREYDISSPVPRFYCAIFAKVDS